MELRLRAPLKPVPPRRSRPQAAPASRREAEHRFLPTVGLPHGDRRPLEPRPSHRQGLLPPSPYPQPAGLLPLPAAHLLRTKRPRLANPQMLTANRRSFPLRRSKHWPDESDGPRQKSHSPHWGAVHPGGWRPHPPRRRRSEGMAPRPDPPMGLPLPRKARLAPGAIRRANPLRKAPAPFPPLPRAPAAAPLVVLKGKHLFPKGEDQMADS